MKSAVVVDKPTIEYHHGADLTGIGESCPRLSWKILSAPSGFDQKAYEIKIYRTNNAGESFCRSLRVQSTEQILVPWPDTALTSREKVEIAVRVSDGQTWSSWSDSETAEVGLLSASDWKAKMIVPPFPADRFIHGDVHLIRKCVQLKGSVASARLYTTAHGLFEAEINGIRVGTEILQPGWTSYHHRLRYTTHDVTKLLSGGTENVLGFWLSHGWYKGRFGFLGGRTNIFGDKEGLFSQLEVVYTSGVKEVFSSDETWKFSKSPITFSGIYDGEHYDASKELADWSSSQYDDSTWLSAHVKVFDPSVLIAPDGPPVRCTEIIQPVQITRLKNGRHLVDFGQNFSGRLQVSMKGISGHKVTFRHAEVLQGDTICTRPLRHAQATDSYIFGKKHRNVVWETKFTIHGFRYAEIEGLDGDCVLTDVVAKVYHSDMTRTGYFACSDNDVNRLFDNALWSMRSNFVDIPTDCPQRDERLGWTGDIQVFGPSAAFLYDIRGVIGSWLKDLAAEQNEYGNVPWYVPYVPGAPWPLEQAGNLWGDVATITPWDLFQYYGDTGVLERQYPSAKAWVEKVLVDFCDDSGIVSKGAQLADWLDPLAPPDKPELALTDPALVATAYTLKSLRILSETAGILGNIADEKHYQHLFEVMNNIFITAFFTDEGISKNRTQTAYALAITFGLLSYSQSKVAGNDLASLVRANEGKIATGFAGTPIVLDALSQTGHLDEAFMLLLCKECPSWLYQVSMGATTIWERWDSMLPDGTINLGEMTSFNHYALGSVIKWLYQVIGGIQFTEPGFKRIKFKPQPGGGITKCSTKFDTPYGLTSIKWTYLNNHFETEIVLPVGCTGSIELPDGQVKEVTNGDHSYAVVL